MLEFKTTMSANGRIVIPVKCREALHLEPGETILIRIEGDEAKMYSAKAAIERAQRIVTDALKGKKVLVDDLLKTRRAETKNG